METCTNCHIGHLQPKRVTYMLPFEGSLVTVPLVPAWLCDACGELTYDEALLAQLDMLLGIDAELEPNQLPRTRRPAVSFGREEPALHR